MSEPYDPAREGAQMAFDGRMSYGDYLRIDSILGSQHLLTGAHDEMLFIIQHQTSELWMRLALHEIDAARAAIAADELRPAFKLLSRVARIFEQLNNAWDVLRTMTPADYTRFRDGLGQSSGFQSWQYRLIEYATGNRNAAMLRPHAHRPDIMARLEAELARPSLYDEALRHLARHGHAVPDAVLQRDVDPELGVRPGGAGCLDGDLPRPRGALGSVRAGREAGGFRRLLPALAVQPRDDGGARDRPEARHRRHRRRQLSAADAGGGAVSRALAVAHRLVTFRCGGL